MRLSEGGAAKAGSWDRVRRKSGRRGVCSCAMMGCRCGLRRGFFGMWALGFGKKCGAPFPQFRCDRACPWVCSFSAA